MEVVRKPKAERIICVGTLNEQKKTPGQLMWDMIFKEESITS